MNNSPLISVLVAAYNAEQYISIAINSILQQTYQNLEILICDDSSSDSTLSILYELQKKDTKIKILRNEINQGYLKTFNRLLTEATGDYVTFVDADDFIEDEKIERQYNFLINNPQIGIVGTQFASVSSNGKIINRSSYPLHNNEIVQQMAKEMCFCGSSVMVRKSIVDKVGGYRDFFAGYTAEDYDWIYRISDITQVANLEYVGYYYRFHNQSLTRKVHFSLKHRHIHDIVKFLAAERKATGSDFIMRNDEKTYEALMEKINIPYKKDKGLLYRRVVIEYAINKDSRNAEMYFRKLQKLTGYSIKNVTIWFMMKLLLNVNYNTLLKIKNFLGLSHLSSHV